MRHHSKSMRKVLTREARLVRERALAAREAGLQKALFESRKKQPQAENLFEKYLLPYSTHFVNHVDRDVFTTKSQSPARRVMELVKKSFGKYRVCPQLSAVWIRDIEVPRPAGYIHHTRFDNRLIQTRPTQIDGVDFRLWYICVANGGSLYKEHTKKWLTRSETHTLLNCPHDLSIEQLVVYSIAKTFQPQDGLALRIARSKLANMRFTEFLKTVIYFYAKNVPASIDELNDTLDFILDKHNRREPGRPAFTLSGFTLESLKKRTQDWHYELRRARVMGEMSWDGVALNDESMDKRGELLTDLTKHDRIKWHMTQLKTAKALASEGTTMRHCVFSYKRGCSEGTMSIWSLAREEDGIITKKVTVELSNRGEVVQARGVANRPMKPEERHIVSLWCRRNWLTIGSYV